MADQHVVKRGTDWAVLKANGKRDTAVLDTQAAAIRLAKQIANNQGGEVIIHNRKGVIRDKDTHGKIDHHPPKG